MRSADLRDTDALGHGRLSGSGFSDFAHVLIGKTAVPPRVKPEGRLSGTGASSPARQSWRRQPPLRWPRPSRPLPRAPCALAWDRAHRVVARLAFHQTRLVEQQHAIGRQRALGEPGLGLFDIELHALGLVLRQQRIEVAEPLDEARRAASGCPRSRCDRPAVSGAGAGKTNFQRHRFPFFRV